MTRSLLSYSIILLLGIVIWWMSANVVWLGDDIDYKYMMKGEIWQSWGYINSVGDFFKSQWIHYQQVNGRFVAHSLVQLFNALLGQQTFAVCNGIVYMLFALLLAKAAGIRMSENPGGALSAICLSVLCFITKMMPTCQIGYIWGMAANIGWLMVFFRKGPPSWPLTILMLLIGVIVGNWQESVSIGMCMGIGIWWIIQSIESGKQRYRKFEWRRGWMILGYVIGTAINCLAPSTIGRVSSIDMPLFDRLLISSYSFPAIILLVIAIIFVGIRHGDLKIFSFRSLNGGIPEGVLFLAIIALITFNIAIGVYSNRQLFGANLFAAILTLRILPRHTLGAILNTIASIAVIAFWTLMANSILEVKRQYDEVVSLHSESKDGSVYFDRTRVMTLGFPLRAKYYEDILGLFDNDLHHSLMKDFKHTRRGKTLKLKPTAGLDGEHVEQYAPGHFNVTLKEPPKGEAPREVIVYGHYPMGIKPTPRRIAVTKYFKKKPPYATAVIIPEFPFFTADSLRIIEN